jgi:hypothetical protein
MTLPQVKHRIGIIIMARWKKCAKIKKKIDNFPESGDTSNRIETHTIRLLSTS